MVQSIVEAVQLHARENPDKLCLADETECVTYAQYDRRIRQIAAWLTAKGIGRGDAVVAEASQTVQFLALELALHLIGAVFVPMERSCAHAKIEQVADFSHAKATVTQKPIEGARYPNFTDETLAQEAAALEPLTDFTLPTADATSELLFSTGTTGKEKGIIITHGNDVALAENVRYGVEMLPDNVELIPSPLNHSHGLRRYYGNMLCGSTVVLITGVMNLKGFFQSIETYGVNSMDMVPTALSVLLKLSKNKLAEYKDRLRYIQLGAAPLMEADKDRLKELLPTTRLYNFYGSTESGCICIYNFNGPTDKPHCIGKPAHNAHIVIVDDQRQIIESSAEHTGLLACKGGQNTPGYWEDPAETAKVLENGYFYSNDVAYFDEDGDIILLGRQGDVINVGGNKVSPEEIENATRKLPEVADCGCIPVSDPMQGSVPKLFVQMNAGKAFDAVAIRSALASQLEPYKVPKYIEQIDRIPRTYNGKLLRRELPR